VQVRKKKKDHQGKDGNGPIDQENNRSGFRPCILSQHFYYLENIKVKEDHEPGQDQPGRRTTHTRGLKRAIKQTYAKGRDNLCFARFLASLALFLPTPV
jgi:hypothetical protein